MLSQHASDMRTPISSTSASATVCPTTEVDNFVVTPAIYLAAAALAAALAAAIAAIRRVSGY